MAYPRFPPKPEPPFQEKALQWLKEKAPPLTAGGAPIPGAVTVIALPLIMIGIGLIYYLQRR